MNKFLAYGLWMLLNLSPASATWCFNCEKPFPGAACPVIHEFCWAGEGESCYTQNLFIGDACIKSVVGCIRSCQDNHQPDFFMWQETMCCYSDYCNE